MQWKKKDPQRSFLFGRRFFSLLWCSSSSPRRGRNIASAFLSFSRSHFRQHTLEEWRFLKTSTQVREGGDRFFVFVVILAAESGTPQRDEIEIELVVTESQLTIAIQYKTLRLSSLTPKEQSYFFNLSFE